MALAMKADDDTKKTEYHDMVLKLYDQQMECYKNVPPYIYHQSLMQWLIPCTKYLLKNYSRTFDTIKEAQSSINMTSEKM